MKPVIKELCSQIIFVKHSNEFGIFYNLQAVQLEIKVDKTIRVKYINACFNEHHYVYNKSVHGNQKSAKHYSTFKKKTTPCGHSDESILYF